MAAGSTTACEGSSFAGSMMLYICRADSCLLARLEQTSAAASTSVTSKVF